MTLAESPGGRRSPRPRHPTFAMRHLTKDRGDLLALCVVGLATCEPRFQRCLFGRVDRRDGDISCRLRVMFGNLGLGIQLCDLRLDVQGITELR